MDSTAVAAIIGLIGVLVGAGLTGIVTNRSAHKERLENRRREKQIYLAGLLKRLTELRAKLEYFHSEERDSDSDIRERIEAFGEVYAILKGINDPQMRQLAVRILGPNDMLEQIGQTIEDNIESILGITRDTRLNALDKAIVRLGDLIDEVMEYKKEV